jgi:hypothetical protein
MFSYHIRTVGTINKFEGWEGSDAYSSIEIENLAQKKIVQEWNRDHRMLAGYIHDTSLKSVVRIGPPEVTVRRDDFILDWVADSENLLTNSQVRELLGYIEGQCSDGWGEGFEQQSVSKDPFKGDLYCSPWDEKKPKPKMIGVREASHKEASQSIMAEIDRELEKIRN